MLNEQQFQTFPTRAELLLVGREKDKLSKFVVRNAAGETVAQLGWSSLLQPGKATGSWAGGQIHFKQRRWWSADMVYQLSGTSAIGELPFAWRHFSNDILWENERFRLKTKGWFLRHFQLFDANDALLAEYRLREKFISFKLEISIENRLFKYKNPEALLLTGLFLLFIRLRRAKSAS